MNWRAATTALRRFRSSKYFWPALIVVFVLAANALYITGVFSDNPINERSGLASTLVAGPVAGQYTIDPSDGFYAQALGRGVASSVLHGHLPWWNYNEGVGDPLAGGLQAGALFPLQFLLLFADGLFYLHLCLEIITGLATFYFLKRLRCRDDAAAIGAMAFAVNGTYAWIAHTIFNPIAFLPLLLLGVEIARDKAKERQARGWILIAVAIAATVYANFPETGYIDTMFAGLWALVRMRSLPKDCYAAYCKKLLVGAAVGIALAAPLLVAFADYLPQANVGLHAANTSHLTLPHIGLASLAVPYMYGQIFANAGSDASGMLNVWWGSVGGFLSLALIFLALIGLTTKLQPFRRADKAYLAGWTVFCILATYGIFGFNDIAGHVPGLSSSAFARYFPPTYEFAVTVLATMGLSYVFEHRQAVRRKQVMIVAAGLLATTILLVVCIARPELHNLATAHRVRLWFELSVLCAGCMIIGVAISLWFIRRKFGVVALVLLALADVTIPYVVPMFSAPRSAKIDTAPVQFLRSHLGFSRFYSMGPIAPNYGTYFGLASVNISDVPQPKTYSAYITGKLDPHVDPIIFSGVGAAPSGGVSPRDAFLQNIKNYEALSVKYVVVYTNFFSQAQITSADLTQVFNDGFAAIYQLPSAASFATVLSGSCAISVQAWNKIVVDCQTPATVTRREQYMNGWTAKVDGKSTPLASYATIFQKVNVPAGKHTVTFSYLPPHVYFGYAATIIACAFVAYAYREVLLGRLGAKALRMKKASGAKSL